MGNTNSNVTSGVKKQADTSSQKIYQLLDVKGGGQLITLMSKALKDRAALQQVDEQIRQLVEPFLYNKGQGKLVPISELVLLRNKDRPKNKQITPPKNSQSSGGHPTLKAMRSMSTSSYSKHFGGPSGSTIPKSDDFQSGGGIADSATTINGSSISHKKELEKYREVCWDLNQRGSVGETAIHLCFLNSSTVHAELAKRLIKVFPKLINDYYTCDEYYGENALHMAIVNEDPAMVKFLLDNGANSHERCVGNFFCPEDQKASRTDNLDYEWVEVATKTNFEGHVYWGEYPHAFAACLNQEECYRLLLAKGADPDSQDTNGNTATHIMVIHENIHMFDMVYELGGSINVPNKQGLTPLTLAAKLSRKGIFMHILKLHRDIYWQLGSITCAAYPLEEIDTINTITGEISKASALNLIVFGEKSGHLDMMEGLLSDLLSAKWRTFIKFRFYSKFILFIIYFLLTMACFVIRPGPLIDESDNTTSIKTEELFSEKERLQSIKNSSSENDSIASTLNESLLTEEQSLTESTPEPENQNKTAEFDKCYLLDYSEDGSMLRLVLELLTSSGALMYLLEAAREVYFLGYRTFWENLMTVPSRVLFLVSCCMVILMLPLRFSCECRLEDMVAVLVMVSTAPYFLFFCRGFRMIGPIVVMIYKMILTDLLCFVTIYLVFVIGFSQAYFVIFLSYSGDSNFFSSPFQSIMALFVMSLTQFQDIYAEFDNTQHPIVAKAMFIVYMALVGILLINMLIAMMGKTYQDIAARKNEWMRQWARIVLVVERGVPPKECLSQILRYSQPMADGRRALVIRLQHDEHEKEELRMLDELKTAHFENRRRQEAGSNILSPRSTPRKTISSTSL